MESKTARADPPTFRRRWWGYDAKEVEEFLRQTAADRQRHQESLAWLEALMAGYDQQARDAALAAARRESHEARIAALRTTAGGLARAEAGPSRVRSTVAIAMAFWVSLRSIARRHAYALLVCAFLSVTLLAVLKLYSRTSEARAIPVRAGSQDGVQLKLTSNVPARGPDALRPDMPGHPVAQMPGGSPSPVAGADGLVLTLTARRPCWIGTVIDGGQRLERLLQSDETVMLHVHDEVVLRVGDAAALSVLINNQPTRPLGVAGQVVTRRISQSNYLSLLVR